MAVLAIGIVAFSNGYYLLPQEARAGHDLHELLRASGPLGVGLGFLGTTLMVLMLTYSLRKRWVNVQWLGPVPAWLRFHIICGVMGPIFILLHAGLMLPTGIDGVAMGCMVLVALSGVFGRYVYGLFPKTAFGLAAGLDESRGRLARLRSELVAQTQGQGAAIGEAVRLSRDFEREATSLLSLFSLDLEVRRRRRRIGNLLHSAGLEGVDFEQAHQLLTDQLKMKRSLETWGISQRVFRYWHLFHLPLAKAMYAIVFLHITKALFLTASWQNLKILLAGQ